MNNAHEHEFFLKYYIYIIYTLSNAINVYHVTYILCATTKNPNFLSARFNMQI